VQPADRLCQMMEASPHCYVIESERGILITGSIWGEVFHIWSSGVLAGKMSQQYAGTWVSQIAFAEVLQLIVDARVRGVRRLTLDRGPEPPVLMMPIDEAIETMSAHLGISPDSLVKTEAEPGSSDDSGVEASKLPVKLDDEKLSRIRSLSERFHQLLDRYSPGRLEMGPGNRPHWLASALRDPQIVEYVFRYLQLGEGVALRQFTAAFELADVPNEQVEALLHLLRNFRAIYVANYHDRLLYAKASGLDITDPNVIDPEIGDLSASEADFYDGGLKRGWSTSQARDAVKRLRSVTSAPKGGGCAGVFMLILVVVIFALGAAV
jgi:hypothetical protein